jgi:hypothetical protein
MLAAAFVVLVLGVATVLPVWLVVRAMARRT